MAPKSAVKPPPPKKKRKSKASRNKSSSLSIEYQSRESSDDSRDHASESLGEQRRKKPQNRLDAIWQDPSFATQLSIAASRSEESEQTDQAAPIEILEQTAEEPRETWFASGQNEEDDDSIPEPTGMHRTNDRKAPKIFSRIRYQGTPPIDSALVIVHNQLVALESRFQKDLHELEKKYVTSHYAPLLKLRNRLLEAAKAMDNVETRPEECRKHAPVPAHRLTGKRRNTLVPEASKGSPNTGMHIPSCQLFECCAKVFLAEELGKKEWHVLERMLCRISEAMYQYSHCNDCLTQPHKFWYYVFQRSDPMLSSMLSSSDAEVLTFLRDVRVNLFTTSWPDSPDSKFDIGVKRRHPPFMRSARSPKVSARASVSLPGQTTKSLINDDTDTKAMYPSSRPFHCNSEMSRSQVSEDKNRDYSATVIGFELEFEFYPNKFIANGILRKRYLIDVQPQDEDYVRVKKYKTFRNPQDSNSKVDLFTSDGGDELSSETESDEPNTKRNGKGKTRKSKEGGSRSKKQPCHKLLDYRGPRLVAIEGSTIKWKSKSSELGKRGHRNLRCNRPWLASSDHSVRTSSSADSLCPKTSFLDFFGWNWDIYRNKIMTNDALKLIELTSSEIRAFVTRDYEVGSYIRDTVIPRAFAIYRSCKRTDLKTKTRMAESILDSISQGASSVGLDTIAGPQTSYHLNPVYAIPQSSLPPPPPPLTEDFSLNLPPPQNHARDYDDVDDVIEIVSKTQQPEPAPESVHGNIAIQEDFPQPAAQDSENLTMSRQKVSDLVKNVNTILHQANAHNAFHQPFIPTEPAPGAPLTCAIDSQIIPDIQENLCYQTRRPPPDSDEQSSGVASRKGEQADDENNWSEVDPPSVNRAFEKIRGQFRRRSWKKPSLPEKPQKPKIDDQDDDDIVSSMADQRERVSFQQGSPCPSDENAKIDESDVISSSGVSEVQGDSETPSTSEVDDPNLCPCDLHMLDEAGIKGGRRRRNRDGDHILCRRNRDQPLCSLGQDILTDQKLREEYTRQYDEKKKDDSFKEVCSSDSEAPPPPDPKSCKQQ